MEHRTWNTDKLGFQTAASSRSFGEARPASRSSAKTFHPSPKSLPAGRQALPYKGEDLPLSHFRGRGKGDGVKLE